MGEKRDMHKIAVIMDCYFRGGVAMAAQVFLQFLAKQHYEITLFVRDYDEENMLSVPEGVICRPWPDFQTALETFRSEGVSAACGILRNRLYAALNVRNYGKRVVYNARCRKMFPGEFDCAIAYHMIPNDVSVATLEKIRAKRKVLWLHGKKNFRVQDLVFYDTLYSKADKIVCVSLDTETRFQSLMPKSAGKTVTIHNLYDIPFIHRQALASAEGMDVHSSAIKIVSVGRISKEKGFDRVPEIVRRLTDAGYDFQWYIVGEGNKRAEIEADIRERCVEDRVHLLGYRSNPYSYVQQCDIYVQPSYTEGFCTSTVEAKILYKPVVATDVPGMREQFVDGENGLIVGSSVDGIYEGVRQLLDSPALRKKIVEKLRTEPVPNEEVLRQTMEAIDGTKKETLG